MTFIKTITVLLSACFLLNGCSVVNSIRMMAANNDLEPIWAKGASEQSLEAVYIGEKPYIYLTANNDKKLLFLIDTGASFTMLFDTQKGAPLASEKGFDMQIAGWGDGEDTYAYQSSLKSLQIGKVSFKNVKVAYIPISTSQYYMRPDEAIFDGVLGHDILRHFSWTFDKANNTISLSATPYLVKGGDTNLPMDVTFVNKISIPIKIRFNDTFETERDVLIDTGSRHYMKLSSSFPTDSNIDLPLAQVEAADFGMSGMTKHKRVTLPSVSFGNIDIENVKTNLIPSDDEDDWWVIGSALMNQFVTVIDYRSQQFIIRPYSNLSFHSRYNLAGLDLRKLQNGDLLVKYVFPNLPAERAGIKGGDVITSINQALATALSEEDWIAMNAQANQFVMCTKSQECVNVTTTAIKGYSSD
jgi:predicted aspartyl protease